VNLTARVDVEYNGKTVPIDFVWTKIDLVAIHVQLSREFEIPQDTIITGFILDADFGGPICPFRLFEGLRGIQLRSLASLPNIQPLLLSPIQKA
jgi:hypothetical protein